MSDIKFAKELLSKELENFRIGKLDYERLYLKILLLKSPNSEHNLSLSTVLDLLEGCRYVKYKLHPQKPKEIQDYSDLKLVRWYQDALRTYSLDLNKFLKEWDSMNQVNDTIPIICRRLICEEAELNLVPEKARDKVYHLAYEYGHSSGYMEVLKYLYDLVNLFR